MKNSSVVITATLLETDLLKSLVEELADRKNDIGYSYEKVQPGWSAMEISSIEAYVSGDINLSDNNPPVKMSFDTSFLFTCIKERRSEYNLTWVSSLS